MESSQTFWQHLDALRGVLVRMGVTVFVAVVALFVAMPSVFDYVVLWPCRADFPLYRLFDLGREWFERLAGPGAVESAQTPEALSLININLGSQLMVQMSMSVHMALILTFPLLVYMLWGFVSPGLYPREKRNATRAFVFANIMFYIGVAVGYFLVFPLTLRFLSQYQLSKTIVNTLTLDSYIDNFLIITMLMGAVFELPLLAWLLGKAGGLTRSFFGKYRRHAVVALLVVAALITPTGDPLSLAIVFVPLYLLWESSACLVRSR